MIPTSRCSRASASHQGYLFRVRCEGGHENRLRLPGDSITVTGGQRVLRNDLIEMGDSVSVYAKQDAEGDLVVEVLGFSSDWDEPLRIAPVCSRPGDGHPLCLQGAVWIT